MYELLGWEY